MSDDRITPMYELAHDPPEVCSVLGRFMGTWAAGGAQHVLALAPLAHTRAEQAEEHHRQWRIAAWLVNQHLPAWLDTAGLGGDADVCRDLAVNYERRQELSAVLDRIAFGVASDPMYDDARSERWPYRACPKLTVLSGAAVEACRWLAWQVLVKRQSMFVPPVDVALVGRLTLFRALVVMAAKPERAQTIQDVQAEQEQSALRLVRELSGR
jgi:hypothetical protein